MINVTEPFFPPLEEYNDYLKLIWDRKWFTNNGPIVQSLENQVINYLKSSPFLFTSNGTIALQLAINALELKGEIITTPFSYVATTSSIVWEKCIPIFVDIDPETWNIDYNKIEEKITDRTSAIIATHVFGVPCEIDEIQKIAQKHNLKVIYDASHCFGSEYKGKSVFNFGDISTVSFHATKLFHTVEGGGVFTNSLGLFEKLRLKRNFGHNGPFKFQEVGINGKNSEVHAAMGLCNLKYIDKIKQKRKADYFKYYENLNNTVIFQFIPDHITANYSYLPVLFDSEQDVIRIIEKLEKESVSPRRYFYPSLTDLHYVNPQDVNVCSDLSSRILCLPTYYKLNTSEINFISKIILENI